MENEPMNETQINQKIQNEREQYRIWSQIVKIGSFDIADDHLREFETKLSGLNNKAAKYGTLPITWKNLGSRMKKQDVFADREDTRPEHRIIRVHRIVLFGETPRIAGWEFAATIQHVKDENGKTTGENIVHQIPGMEIPSRFFSVSPVCDHCGTKRFRKDTYLLRDTRNGDWKQVGKSCLGDFTGTKNPEKVAKWAQFYDAIMLCARGFAGREGHSQVFETVEFLARVAARTRRDGFMSRTKAQSVGASLTTADVAFDDCVQSARKTIFKSQEKSIDGTFAPELTEEDKTRAQSVIDWVRAGMGTAEPKRDSFQRNLIATLRINHVSRRETGIAAAAFIAHQKFIEAQLLPAPKVSHWQGKVGEKIELTGIKCIFIREIQGVYGVTVLHKFEDQDGNDYVWFASNEHLDIGETYSGKGTVKSHTTFADDEETVLTRCKLTRNGSAPAIKVKRGDRVRVKDEGWGDSVVILWKSGRVWEVICSDNQNRFYEPGELLEVLPKE
jgi:hypothetical protein